MIIRPKEVVSGLYQISLGTIKLGPVNAFIIRDEDKLTVIDTGYPEPGDTETMLRAISELGHQPSDVQNILVTHAHYDHAGGLAALKKATGAPAWMHPLDAKLVREGRALRPYEVTPGIINHIFCWIYIRGNAIYRVPPTAIEHEVEDGQELPAAGGIRAIHMPGHSAGQLAFLWPKHGGVVFCADAVMHALGLHLNPTNDDIDQAYEDLQKLAKKNFEVAVFGHGNPIKAKAAEKFRNKYAISNEGAL